MKTALFCVLIVAALLGGGCTVSQEQFNKDVLAFIEKPASVRPLLNSPDPDSSISRMYCNLLRDDKVRAAIYAQAANEGALRSTESILRVNWYRTLADRGFRKLPLDQKLALFREMGVSMKSIPDKYCRFPNPAVDLAWVFQAEDRDRLVAVFEGMVKSGATVEGKPIHPPQSEFFLAVIALLAKARERYSDQELLEILAPVIEPKAAKKGAYCKSYDRLVEIMLDLDPKYQETLFDSVGM